MKSLYTFIAILLLSSNSLKGQQHPGFKASLNFSSITSDQIDFTNKIGFGTGFASLWLVSDRLDFFN